MCMHTWDNLPHNIPKAFDISMNKMKKNHMVTFCLDSYHFLTQLNNSHFIFENTKA